MLISENELHYCEIHIKIQILNYKYIMTTPVQKLLATVSIGVWSECKACGRSPGKSMKWESVAMEFLELNMSGCYGCGWVWVAEWSC